MTQSAKFTFNAFDDFITKSFEELCTYEEIFRNQIVVETFTEFVEKNKENLQNIFLAVTGAQCNQQFLNNGLDYLELEQQNLDRGITCFENNFRGPEYLTPKDVARVDLYDFLLCVRTKMANIGDMVEHMNSEIREEKKNIKKNPIEKLAQIMMKHLNLLEALETKILWLNEEVQRILFVQMIIMKKFNLKFKLC
ncbi:uncharacterized protein LOC123314568 [Coccinella septempunctata]|uniref:uncharacterized protein LOC123314568 n=1 Tax=Coccinella septempunctata TaxID=41139 RepID=UPI001D08D1B2|nr:uncharacterized protein LOC123314568 [Coccinella septempunctata]